MQTVPFRLAALFILAVVLTGCGAEQPENATGIEGGDDDTTEAATEEVGLVLASADEYEFRAGSTFPSGWVNIRFTNEGQEPHFLLIWRLPEDRTFEEYASEVADPFQDLYTRYRAGEIDQATFFEQLTAAIPEWFYEATPMGGPGFTSPGHTSETMVYLEPGDNYVLECYVRSQTEDDRFHGSEGMLRPLVVSEQVSDLQPPESDIEVSISNSGLDVTGDLTAGSHVARISVDDVPEAFVRHNVHLVRLEEGQSGADVAPWLNWVDDMLPPAPAEFLGGAGQMVPGRDSYVSIDLDPGRYAWVSEGQTTGAYIHEFSVE